jgi:hypothetical protein
MNKPVSKVREARLELYRKKGKIHAREVRGRFNTIRWAMVWLTQIIFYGACWLQWGGRQAILIDIPHEKFYLFGLVLWPQDALLGAIALILAATGLFLVTAVAGRLFCGFACPQTVYTSIFMWVETRVEGDHLARLKLDQSPSSPRKLALRGTKHALWLPDRGLDGDQFRRLLHADPRAAARRGELESRAVGGFLADLLRLVHLRAGRLRPRGGVPAHVPVLAFPGRDVRLHHAHRQL